MRVNFARDLLRSTAAAQRRTHERRIAAKNATAQAIERRVAEEADRAAKEAAEALRLAERASILKSFRSEADEVLRNDFLSADTWFVHWSEGKTVTETDFSYWKAEFVQDWARRVLHDSELDLEQARAVATTGHDLRLVARAGSGKTRTIVTRTLFLQMHCGVDPQTVMLVAFNRKAVSEIKVRLRDALPVSAQMPHIVTFHALAYALLRPEEDLVFDDEDAESLAQSRKVQNVVDEFLVSRTEDVRRAMLGYFEDSWTAIEKRGATLDAETFRIRSTEVTRVTLGGEYVRSYGERLIANTLFENAIDYKYERNFTRGGFNYRPDFTILAGEKPRVVIEYFGIVGDPEYLANAARKRAFWTTQSDVVFIELSPSDITAGGQEDFRRRLLEPLKAAGVEHRRLTTEEIWQKVRERAIDAFSKSVRNFVNRSRQLDLSPDDLLKRLRNTAPDDDVRDFVSLATEVYARYLELGASEGYEDFSGVMWRAARSVREGRTRWVRAGGSEQGCLERLRFLHIDEFQDFSLMFMEFVRSIRSQAPGAVLCCVGDDWQAINQFAGADLEFFDSFEKDFEAASTQHLATNYRSPRLVVSAGNEVMRGMGVPARPFQEETGQIRISRLDTFQPSGAEQERFHGDIGTPALIRLIRKQLDETPGNLAVLFRSNTVPWFTSTKQSTFGRKLDGYLASIQEHFSDADAARIELTTTHKFKGREAPSVIIADADARSYPLIHPSAPLFKIFGDTASSLQDAERRLFYVATTRPQTSLWYLVPREEPSPFLTNTVSPDEIPWTHLPSGISAAGDTIELRIYDGFDVRETLKNPFGFTFNEATKTWFTFRPREGFDFEDVRRRLNFIGTRLIEARSNSNEVLHHAGQRLKRESKQPPTSAPF